MKSKSFINSIFNILLSMLENSGLKDIDSEYNLKNKRTRDKIKNCMNIINFLGIKKVLIKAERMKNSCVC